MSDEVKMNSTNVAIPVELVSRKGLLLKLSEVELSVNGPQSVDSNLKETNGKFSVLFSTTTPGTYTVSLKDKNGDELKLSPVNVEVRLKKDENDAAPAPAVPNLEKQHVEFQVEALDESGKPLPDDVNELVVSVDGPDKSVTPEVQREGTKLNISFDTLINEGQFTVTVKHNGQDIQRSPFVINIVPEKNTNSNEEHELEKRINGVLTLDPLPAHKEINFSVLGRLRNLEYTKAAECVGFVVLGEDEKVPVVITDEADNKFKVSFNALKEGKHKISITHNGEEIVNSPFSVVIPPEAFGRK